MIIFSKTFINQYDANEVFYTVDDLDLMASIAENTIWNHYVFANDWYTVLSNIIISHNLHGVFPVKDLLALTDLNSKGIQFLKILAENNFNVCVR